MNAVLNPVCMDVDFVFDAVAAKKWDDKQVADSKAAMKLDGSAGAAAVAAKFNAAQQARRAKIAAVK